MSSIDAVDIINLHHVSLGLILVVGAACGRFNGRGSIWPIILELGMGLLPLARAVLLAAGLAYWASFVTCLQGQLSK